MNARHVPSAAAPSHATRVLVVIAVSVLVVFMDGMVLNVALPSIQRQLGATQSQQQWAVAAYTLVFAALLLPMGVAADRYGRRRLLAGGLGIFGAASLAAAFSPTPTYLIVMRAVMGVAGAAIVPATLAVITATFDGAARGRAIGVWAATSGLAVSIGPLVAGLLLEAGLWWGSVLLINVPVVAAAAAGVLAWIPKSRSTDRPPLDPVGVVLSVIGLTVLVFGVVRAGQTGDWTAAGTVGAIALGLVILVMFVAVEARSDHAALDVRWFKQRPLAGAAAAMGLAMFAIYGVGLYGIYYLQFFRGYTPLASGVLLLGNAAAIMVAAPASAVLANRYGQRRVCAAGFLVLAASYAAMATVEASTSIVVVEVILVLLGAGSGIVITPTTDVVMARIPRERAGAGSAFNSGVRSLGGALGIAVLGSVLATAYRAGIGGSLTGLPPSARSDAGESIGATQLAVARLHDTFADHGASLLEAAGTAFTSAMHVTAWLSVASVVAAFAVVMVCLPRRPQAGLPPA